LKEVSSGRTGAGGAASPSEGSGETDPDMAAGTAPSPIIQTRSGGVTSLSSVSMAGMKAGSIASNFGAELRRMWLSWMPRSAVLIGTVTAPIQAQPR
jgi:hypothetical protein